MADESTATSAQDKEPDLKALHQRWLNEIDLYEREADDWVTRSRKIVKLFKDSENKQGRRKRFNVLWSNVQTLQPALYARDPKPEVERRHKDQDPIGRAASEVLQRCVSYTIACHGFSQAMKRSVQDRLLPGRGVIWVRYVPTTEPVGGEEKTQVTEDAEPAERLTYEQAIPDYVFWEDFGHNVARTWEEVTCVWRKVYMTRAQLVKRFGKKGQAIPLDYTPKGLKDERLIEAGKKACIYEGWDKEAGAVWFLSKSHPEIIEYKADPLNLTGVFPCPEPLFATITNDSLIPTPDYVLYQTQAQEIEELTARIDCLQKALRLVGVYDSSAPALQQLLTGGENKMVPVEGWAKFSEKGGIDGSVAWLPIKEVADVLIGLYESREKAKQDLYEITGIADIIRGNSDPRETAKAQQIKGRFAVLRISDAQSDVQRYARDVIRLLAEIIAEHFSLDTIKAISGYRLLTEAEKQQIQAQPQMTQADPKVAELMQQPSWEQVYSLLRNNVLREFRVDVETDSTIRTDEEADRLSRTEFLTAASGYIRQAVEAAQLAPEVGPLLGELLMFGVRSFKTGRTLEPVFEEALRKMQQPKPEKPDPEMAKVQAQMQLEQMKAQTTAQLEREKMQIAAQQEQAVQSAQAQQEMQRQQVEDERAERDAQRQAELERFKAQLQFDLEREKAALEREKAIEVEQIKAASAERIAGMQAQYKAQEIDQQREAKSEEIKLKAATDTESRRMESVEKQAEREHETRVDSEKTQQLLAAAGEITRALSELKKLRGRPNA